MPCGHGGVSARCLLHQASTDGPPADAAIRLSARAEVDRHQPVLCRRTKNTRVLVGDPGVGKTAHQPRPEARRSVQWGDVPEVLQDATIFALDMGARIRLHALLRGDFETPEGGSDDRLEALPGSVLFIDGDPTGIGAGARLGRRDEPASNCYAGLASATCAASARRTYKEYRNYFSIRTVALVHTGSTKIDVHDRRSRPSSRSPQGLKPTTSITTGCAYTQRAIKAAVELRARYINDPSCPHKRHRLL